MKLVLSQILFFLIITFVLFTCRTSQSSARNKEPDTKQIHQSLLQLEPGPEEPGNKDPTVSKETWQKCLGGSNNEFAYSVQQTKDYGYIIAGETHSDDDDVTGNHGLSDGWVVKLDESGTMEWQKCLGAHKSDFISSIQQIQDTPLSDTTGTPRNGEGGYIVAGSINFDNEGSNFRVVKLDESGTILWQNNYGGSGIDAASDICQTADGGFIVVGYTSSNDSDVSGHHGEDDFWVIKLDKSGTFTGMVPSSVPTPAPTATPVVHADSHKIIFREYEDYISVFGYEGSDSSVIIPETYNGKKVTKIERSAFYQNKNLETITLPSGLTAIDDYAFYSCNNLKGHLDLPDGLTSIGKSAFYGCSRLTGTLTLPTGITNLGEYAFSNCKGFTGPLIVPKGITSISPGTFSDCSGLSSLTLPPTLISIGRHAFSGCTGFAGPLVLPDSLTAIHQGGFSGCKGFTGSLILPQGLVFVGSSAFKGCSGFTGSLILPENLTTIESGVFEDCSGFIGSLVLPRGIVSVGSKAFKGCSGFTSVTLPSGLTFIDYWAFGYCKNLVIVQSHAIHPPKVKDSTLYIFDNTHESLQIQVPASSVDAYKNAVGLRRYSNRISALPEQK